MEFPNKRALGVSLLALMVSTAAYATETITYTYDAQGRLIRTQTTGDASTTGNATGTAYDPAHNRYHYASSLSGAALPSAPPPQTPPPPPPTNQPPNAVADALANISKCTIRDVPNSTLLANDTDPEANYPLTITGASPVTAGINAYVLNSTTIQIESGDIVGAQTFQYTVADSLGAVGIGTVSINVTNVGSCLNLRQADPGPGEASAPTTTTEAKGG